MFDMSADVRGLFTWNTKLVFLYVTAEYQTELNALNQIVIWDYIIEDVEHAELTVGRSQTMLLPRHHNEYPLIDQVCLPRRVLANDRWFLEGLWGVPNRALAHVLDCGGRARESACVSDRCLDSLCRSRLRVAHMIRDVRCPEAWGAPVCHVCTHVKAKGKRDIKRPGKRRHRTAPRQKSVSRSAQCCHRKTRGVPLTICVVWCVCRDGA